MFVNLFLYLKSLNLVYTKMIKIYYSVIMVKNNWYRRY